MVTIPKRVRIFVEAVILVVLIVVQTFIIIVSSIDLEKYHAGIVETLSDSLGGRVRLGAIEFSLFPYFGVRGRDFYLTGNETTPTIRADEVVIGVNIVPLISGRVVPKKLRVISPTVFLTVNRDELMLDKMAGIINRAAPAEGERITLREVVIHDASLRVTDMRLGRVTEYTVTLTYGWIKGDLKKGPLKYSLMLVPPGGVGTIKSKGESLPDGTVTADIWLKQVSLDPANLVFTDYGNLAVSGTVSGMFTLAYADAAPLRVQGHISGTDLRLGGSSAYPGGLAIDEIDLSGTVTLSPEGIDIRNLVISRDSLYINADCSLRKVLHRGGLLDDLAVSAKISGFDLRRDLELVPFGLMKGDVQNYASTLLMGGRVDALIEIGGNPVLIGTKAATLEVVGKLTGGVLDLGGIVVSGVRAGLSLSADEITVKDVVFTTPPGRIRELRWRVERTFKAPYIRDLVVTVDDMAFEDVKDILASKVVAALPFLEPTEGVGRVKGDMRIEAPMGETPGVPEVTGRVEFTDWALKVPFFTKAPRPGAAELIFEKDRMKIPPFTVEFFESTITGEGELTDFARPRLMMSIASPVFDLVELFGTGDADLRLTELTSRVIFEEGYLLLSDLKARLYGGSCGGDFGYVYTDQESEGLFYLNITGEKTDLGALLSDSKISNNVTGNLDFVLAMKSDPGEPDTILKTMDGTVGIVITNGTIRKLSVLSKIMSIMNISNYLRLKLPKLDTEGMPFDSISGDFIVEDGALTTENLFIDSRVMKISAVGRYDLVADDLDMVIGLQLLQTIDLIVNKIPVVGYILTGEDGNLFTTYFRITGKLDDPHVETMTLQGLGEGTLNIFERIFRFPLKGFIPR